MKNRLLIPLISLIASAAPHLLYAAPVNLATRLAVGRTLTRIVGREVAGGYVKVQQLQASQSRVRVHASIGLSYYPFREANVRAMRDSVRALLPPAYRKARIEIYTDRREIGDLIPMACRRSPQPHSTRSGPKTIPFVNPSERPLVTRLSHAAPAPKQGLAGRHIALWQSHGRYFDQPENRWKWQRAQLWQTCEDLYTQSYVLPYLVPMLENAGACVLLPRERDISKAEVLADNDLPDQYEETGAWQPGGVGFAHRKEVYRTGENPFRDGSTRRIRSVADGPASGKATWHATLPERGEYGLYVSYESLPESVDDAHYTVHHLGGDTEFAVNQTMGGGTWIYLGRFAFAAGRQPVVTLSNRSRTPGRIVSADGVKIGGGYGNIARTVCDSLRHPDSLYRVETSGYPRFCEGARYWLQWAGFDESVYSPKRDTDDYKDDYMSRAHWVNALAGGSPRMPDSAGLRVPIDMALAFHSDSGVRDGEETVGTLGIYYTHEQEGRFAGGADRYRSRDLTDLVMTQIVGDIRRTWEPAWQRRGLWNRAYYEARIPGVPSMLLELLSHQNFADMRYGSDPRFKFLVSRAVYKGILRYVCSQYGVPYVVQPLPVEALATEFVAQDKVRISWRPATDSLERSARPDGYVVYTRIDDAGFDNGRYTKQPELLTEQLPGRIYSYRVTAVNAGGESLPSETVAACRATEERDMVFVVNGFDRVSGPMTRRSESQIRFLTDYDNGVPDRVDISFIGAQRVCDPAQARCPVDSLTLGASDCDYETEVIGGNTFDYAALHGRSIVAAGYSFHSASRRAVTDEARLLKRARIVDLILGKQRATPSGRRVEKPVFEAFPDDLQQSISDYLKHGGRLFVTGSYVATDLWRADAPESGREFARSVLGYTSDSLLVTSRLPEPQRGVLRVVAPHPAFSRGDYRYNGSFRADQYRVETADRLLPAGRASYPVMRYADGGVAAVATEGDERRCFVAGFPFECLTDESQRDRMMADVLDFLNFEQ